MTTPPGRPFSLGPLALPARWIPSSGRSSVRPAGTAAVSILLLLLFLPLGFTGARGQSGLEPGRGREDSQAQTSAIPPAEVIFPRTPAPSPDGSEIAFGYQGDIWMVPAGGGMARRLTANPAYESNPIWSPDGRWIAFSSNRDGNPDLYALPLDGGEIRRLTWHSDHDYPTGWTPDSRHVLCTSRRHVLDAGAPGLYLAPLDGGVVLPLIPTGARDAVISPDGRFLAYARGYGSWSRRGYEGSARAHLWVFEPDRPFGGDPTAQVPAPEGRVEAVCTHAGQYSAGALRPNGRHLDLTAWETVDSGRGRDPLDPQVEVGRNAEPQWLPDGRLVYVSERGGISNLKVLSLEDGSRQFLTRLTEGRLRRPALARNGSLAAFEYEDGIYTQRLPVPLPPMDSAQWRSLPAPERLEIRIPRDHIRSDLDRVVITGGAGEVAFSPDGKQYAISAEGEIFCAQVNEDDSYANRLTDHPARDGQITWAKDSESLVFISDRTGNQDLWSVRSVDEDEARLSRSLHLETRQLTTDPAEDYSPQFSPDGRTIAFLRGQCDLMLMDADGSNQRMLLDGWTDIEFRWSPDSRWIAYSTEDFDYNSDLWIVAADGKSEPVNITRHPESDYRPRWSGNGKALAFVSQRRYLDQTDIWYVWLTEEEEQKSRLERMDELEDFLSKGSSEGKEGESGKKYKKSGKNGGDDEEEDEDEEVPEIRIDFKDIHLRARRLTGFPGRESDVLVSDDADQFVFVSDTDGKTDLWRIDWDGSNLTRLTEGGTDPRDIQWGPKNKIFFRKRGGAAASIGLDGGKTTTYSYKSEILVDRRQERLCAFEEGWRALRDRFYDPDMHGVDWEAMGEHYRPWILGASTREDFHDVMKMMIGELNASHLSIWGGPSGLPPDLVGAESGEIGVVFDASHTGPGLRIARVVPGTAADREESRLETGEILLSVNGQAVGPERNPVPLLDRKVDDRVLLTVQGRNGREREVVLRPTSAGEMRRKVVQDEIRARQEYVRERSAGRLGYVFIEGMDVNSLEDFERDLYAVASGKDGLLIDVRDNGGGWTTDILLTSLCFPDHATTVGRNGGPGYPSTRRLLYAWTKPVVVLCDENSFSNAEIFSWAIKTTRRGPLVGRRTFGGVISTGGMTLLDGSWLRLPVRGWYSNHDGTNMENSGCPPDFELENLPGAMARGIDAQLDKAIEEGMRQLD